jgi:phage terminase small subunit
LSRTAPARPPSFSARKAAIRAGYSAKTAEAIGHENLRKPKISEKLEKARAERAERCALSADWVVEELRKLASSNMGDYMKPTPEGNPRLDFSGLTPETRQAPIHDRGDRICRR